MPKRNTKEAAITDACGVEEQEEFQTKIAKTSNESEKETQKPADDSNRVPPSNYICNTCNQPGHYVDVCPRRDDEFEKEEKKESIIWYNSCRKDKVLNGAEILMNQPRIIRNSCLELRDTRRITFRPCNPDSIHNHGEWTFGYSAWDTIQKPGHVGISGSCLARVGTKNFNQVLDFYNKYKNAKYCAIVAGRMYNEKPQKWIYDDVTKCDKSVIDDSYTTGGWQEVDLYRNCEGCGCNKSNFEDWITLGFPTAECTDIFNKPKFLKS